MKTFIRNHKILSAVLLLVLVLSIIGVSVAAANWNQPLTENMSLPTFAPTLTISPTEEITPNTVDPDSPQPEITPTKTPLAIAIANTPTPQDPEQPTPAPMCGGPSVMTILTIGIDTFDPLYLYGLADVVRIVRVDFVTPQVNVLALPRDLWVEIPEISDHYGITQGKLNQSYFYGTKGMGYYDGPGEGAGLMALTLANNLGLFVDRYGSVNMATFADMIDAVGGIDIYLPEDVNGRAPDGSVDYGYFYAGDNHFTGEAAIRFSRIRKSDSDSNRIDRQTQVLYALRDKVQSPAVLPKIPKLISTFMDSIVTDLTPKDISALTCLLPSITEDRLLYARVPDQLLSPGRQYDPHLEHDTWIWEADFEGLREVIGYFQAGLWPVE
jgi:LCP family protein required for cell wall assembly